MSEFAGLRATVVGGTSGIGAAAVSVLRSRGAQVVAISRSAGDDDSIRCDIADDGDLERAIATIDEQWGGLDILVNCAGRGSTASFEWATRDEWMAVLDLNVISMARTIATALPLLRRSSHASVVNVSSILADVGVADRVLYSASKGAVSSMTRALAADHAPAGIRFNAVLPSTTATPWVDRIVYDAADPAAAMQSLLDRQPGGRLIRAREVAHAIAYLASPHSASTTGVSLEVDGGMSGTRRADAPAG